MDDIGVHEQYDVLIVTRKVNTIPKSVAGPEWARLDASLTEAQVALRRVRDSGGNGLVVPSRYRQRLISKDDARALALVAFKADREQTSDHFSDLDDGTDHGACWVFSAENYSAQERGVIPGVRSFWVDVLDGHVWSQPECHAFLAFSR